MTLESLLPLPAVPYDAEPCALSLVRYRTNDSLACPSREVLVRGYDGQGGDRRGRARHRLIRTCDFVFEALLERKTGALDKLPEEFDVRGVCWSPVWAGALSSCSAVDGELPNADAVRETLRRGHFDAIQLTGCLLLTTRSAVSLAQGRDEDSSQRLHGAHAGERGERRSTVPGARHFCPPRWLLRTSTIRPADTVELELVVDKIRSNILTEGSITELVKVVDEEMDGIAQDQRKRLRIIEDELEDVKRRLGRIWNVIETSDVDMADASDRIKEHRERKERLEDAAADARAILSERRAHLDDVKTISAYAKDMRDFLNESELTERRAFIESFVKEIIVMPGDALMRYTVPMPDDSLIPGRATEKVALNGSVLSTVHDGGPAWTRTRDLSLIRTAL